MRKKNGNCKVNNPSPSICKKKEIMDTLFENADNGASFSPCMKYRYSLWRIWDKSNPLVMFIGLNPSTANATSDDPTIRRVKSIAANLGYGGVYMMNCFAYVSTDPKRLVLGLTTPTQEYNNNQLLIIGGKCRDVIFSWGNFNVVRETGRDKVLATMFPGALALHINKNGSPKHPLYCKSDLVPVIFNPLSTSHNKNK